MQPAAPDPAARLETILEAVAVRAEEARARLHGLSAQLDELDHPPAERAPAPPTDPADPVRLAAIELAVAGAGRAATEAELRSRFPGAGLDAVLDDVFG